MASRRLRARQWSFLIFWSLALVLADEEFKCKYLKKRMRLLLQSSVTGKLDLYFVCILLSSLMSKDLLAAVIKSSHLLIQVLCLNWHLPGNYSCRGKCVCIVIELYNILNVSNLRTFVGGFATLRTRCVRLTLLRNKNTWSDDLMKACLAFWSNKVNKGMIITALKQVFDNFNVDLRKNEVFLTSIRVFLFRNTIERTLA